MSRSVLYPPLYNNAPFNTGDGSENGDTPKELTDKINTMLDEVYTYLPGASFFNFKPSNTRLLRKAIGNVRSGTANAAFAMVGDSTTMGAGSGTGGSGFDGARPKTYPKYLAAILNASHIPAQEVGIFGGAGVATASQSTYDTRVSLGAGWSCTSNGLGGAYYANATTSNVMSFTPTMSFDTIVYWYAQRTSGGSTFTIDVDGGAAADTVNSTGASNAMVKRTVSVSLATHTINITRTGAGELDILGVTVYNSASKVLDIWNFGVSGRVLNDIRFASAAWSPANSYLTIAADAFFINLGINDWINGTTLTTFASDYQAIITSLKTVSDVVLINPVPRDITATPLATQSLYADVITGLAETNDLPLIDFRKLLETYEISNPAGLYWNGTHPNAVGYAEVARLMAQAISDL